MPGRWANSDRRKRLPANWGSWIRPHVLRRDGYRCRLAFEGFCIGTATEVDHIRRGDDHAMTNLQAACTPCHRHKSAVEGRAAQQSPHRPPDKHPGLL